MPNMNILNNYSGKVIVNFDYHIVKYKDIWVISVFFPKNGYHWSHIGPIINVRQTSMSQKLFQILALVSSVAGSSADLLACLTDQNLCDSVQTITAETGSFETPHPYANNAKYMFEECYHRLWKRSPNLKFFCYVLCHGGKSY